MTQRATTLTGGPRPPTRRESIVALLVLAVLALIAVLVLVALPGPTSTTPRFTPATADEPVRYRP